MTYSTPGTKKSKDSGICVTGPILKEEAMNIKLSSNQYVLEYIRVSNGLLDKWMLNNGIPEYGYLKGLCLCWKQQLRHG